MCTRCWDQLRHEPVSADARDRRQKEFDDMKRREVKILDETARQRKKYSSLKNSYRNAISAKVECKDLHHAAVLTRSLIEG